MGAEGGHARAKEAYTLLAQEAMSKFTIEKVSRQEEDAFAPWQADTRQDIAQHIKRTVRPPTAKRVPAAGHD